MRTMKAFLWTLAGGFFFGMAFDGVIRSAGQKPMSTPTPVPIIQCHAVLDSALVANMAQIFAPACGRDE
jgi:hypothetical protein